MAKKNNSYLKVSEETLTKEEIKKYKSLLESIGTNKQDGFVFIGQTKRNKKIITIEGLFYINEVSRMAILQTVLDNLEVDDMTLMGLALDAIRKSSISKK